MISDKISTGQFTKSDAGWVSGMNTIRHPWLLREDQYRRGVNVMNRGGIIQTRNGYRMKLILPPGNLQGGEYFKVNKNERNEDWVVLAIGGNVYALPFPLQQPKSWEAYRLKNIQFDPLAPYVYFESAEKTFETLSDQTLKIVPTYNVMMLQDGVNASAFWDGEENRHCDESAPALETPRGTWMSYSGGRLWVARGKIVIASDVRNPIRFVERTEGEGRGDFAMSGEVTGMASFVDNERNEVLTVFTAERSEILKTGIRDRSKWPETLDFQSILFPSTGCVAGHSIVFQAGLMWWYSQGGLVSSDSAASSFLTSQVNYKDAEMAFSKQFLADDQSGIAGLSFENFLLMSMPISQSLNSETFVLDYATMSEASSDKIPAWSSVWTGIRPMQWISARIGKRQRAFALSIDYTALSDGSHNHLWEVFVPEREDTFFELDTDFTTIEYKQPIYCEWESRSLGDGLDLKQFKYAELDLSEISGDVNMRVDYRGRRGGYKQILCKKMIAQTEYENSGVDNFQKQESSLGILRKQSRRIRTETADAQAIECQSCEDDHNEVLDRSFSVLVRWCGQAAIEAVRIVMEAYAEKNNGGIEKDEEQVCVIDEIGGSHVYSREAGFISEDQLYQQIAAQIWISTKSATVTLTCSDGSITGPISVTATASYRSQISQADANSQAQAAAQQAAEGKADYYRSLYPCYWDGFASATRECYSVLDGKINTMAVNSQDFTIVGGEFTHDHATVQNRLTCKTPAGIRKLDFVTGIGFNGIVHDIAIDNLDRVYIVGAFTTYNGGVANRIIRLLADGQIDPGFATGTGFDAVAYTIDFQGGNIIVGGAFTTYNGVSTVAGYTRILPTGAKDGTFTPSNTISTTYKLFVRVDGQIVIAARKIATDGVVKLLTSDGALDGAFAEYVWSTSEFPDIVLELQNTTQVLFACPGINFGDGLVRLDGTGAVDLVFDIGSGFNGHVDCILVHSSGRLFIGGNFTTVDGNDSNRIASIDEDGGRDLQFSVFADNIGVGFNAEVRSIVELPGEILAVGGNFTSFIGSTDIVRWCRITTDGDYVPSVQETTQYASARSIVDQEMAQETAQDLADAKAVAALPCT